MLKSESLHLSESIMPLFINLQHMKKKGMLFTILLITWVAFQAWTQEYDNREDAPADQWKRKDILLQAFHREEQLHQRYLT